MSSCSARAGSPGWSGVDIIQAAEDALYRDRPSVYDAYLTADMTALADAQREELRSWSFDTLVCVAALGFGDIPTAAFLEGFNLIRTPGWVAFNIKETFFDHRDTTGFSRALRELIFSEYMDLYHVERYRHRLSIDGEPLYYFAVAGTQDRRRPRGLPRPGRRGLTGSAPHRRDGPLVARRARPA